MKENEFLAKVRAWEREIAYAPPSKAAKLARKIVKYKSRVFQTDKHR